MLIQPSETFIHTYHGYWTPGARCDVRVYVREGERPLVILTERPDNVNTSITNLSEQVAAEICSQRWPERLRAWTPEAEAPVVVIEHYPADPSMPYDDMLGVDRYAVVDFASWNVGRRFRSGRETVSFGSASWRHVNMVDLTLVYGIDPPRTPFRQKSCIAAQR